MPDQNRKSEVGSEDGGLDKPAEKKPMNNPDEVQERLGFGLRSMYRSVLEEPLPADMMALLDQLDEDEGPEESRSETGSNPSE